MLIYDMYTFGDVCYISGTTIEKFYICMLFLRSIEDVASIY